VYDPFMAKIKAFAPGDIVVLKSGGPPMTIDETKSSGAIRCQWFSGKKLEWGAFPPSSLKHHEPDKDK
jgi:uncharacterized protein YodC (DUF2158 family)